MTQTPATAITASEAATFLNMLPESEALRLVTAIVTVNRLGIREPVRGLYFPASDTFEDFLVLPDTRTAY